MKRITYLFLMFANIFQPSVFSQDTRSRARDIGIITGTMEPGKLNAITDVAGVMVGHQTIITGDSIRTGVTAILPHNGNIFREKVPAAICVFNGFGKLAGYTQVRELGNIETPVILTNTLSVPVAVNALIRYTLSREGNKNIYSVNGVAGETNDGYLNDIRGLHVTENDVIAAINSAQTGIVAEGSVGAGTGTTALGFKGGIGTSSRILPVMDGRQYTVGVLVQSNFGRDLIINGIPFPREIIQASLNIEDESGSCMIVIATDAPLSERNLERLGKRAFTGMGKTTTVMSNGSGDYAIIFSTAYRIPYDNDRMTIDLPPMVSNDAMTIFFRAVEEATQEAIYNSLFMATTVTGFRGHTVEAIPLEQVKELMDKYK
jgi:D-aminopeptidase